MFVIYTWNITTIHWLFLYHFCLSLMDRALIIILCQTKSIHWSKVSIVCQKLSVKHRLRVLPSQRANKSEFDASLNTLLKQQWSCWWFETPWRSCDITVISALIYIIILLNKLSDCSHVRLIGDVFVIHKYCAWYLLIYIVYFVSRNSFECICNDVANNPIRSYR